MGDPNPAAEVLAAVRAGTASGETMPMRICSACVRSMPIDGAALSLIGKGTDRERVGASGKAARLTEELQIVLGEGPSATAAESGTPLLIGDLSGLDVSRWPSFAKAMTDIDVCALFAFPIQIGAVRLGVLTLFRTSVGQLRPHELTDALRVADVIALLLVGQKGELVEDFDERWLDGSTWTREVHQATGMLISQLGVDAEEAFVRLRSFAFSHDRSLEEVAGAIVARRLSLRVDEYLDL